MVTISTTTHTYLGWAVRHRRLLLLTTYRRAQWPTLPSGLPEPLGTGLAQALWFLELLVLWDGPGLLRRLWDQSGYGRSHSLMRNLLSSAWNSTPILLLWLRTVKTFAYRVNKWPRQNINRLTDPCLVATPTRVPSCAFFRCQVGLGVRRDGQTKKLLTCL